jgi:ABC-type polysaccharide/polyol phosphate transport system ATPase subunit
MSSVIEMRDVGKRYHLGRETLHYATLREAISFRSRTARSADTELWALKGIDLEVAEGELLGVVGRNGSGKSTLLKILSRITAPTTGMSRTRGRVSALLEVGTGFHFELTGRANIQLNGTILGMSSRQIAERFDDIVEFAGIERFLDTPLKRYSSGMYLRLAFSVAAHLQPSILLVDEVLAVGDLEFRQRTMGKLSELHDGGRTVVFVSHDLGAIAQQCPRTIWIDGGQIQRDGPTREVLEAYTSATKRALPERTFGSEHWEGPVALRSIAVVRSDGERAETLLRGDPLTVEIVLTASDPPQGLDVALSIDDQHGGRLISDVLSDYSGGLATQLGESGTYRLRVTIPPILAVRQYLLELWIGTKSEDYFHGEVLTVEVQPRLEDRQDWIERPRMIQPSVDWEVERLSPT